MGLSLYRGRSSADIMFLPNAVYPKKLRANKDSPHPTLRLVAAGQDLHDIREDHAVAVEELAATPVELVLPEGLRLIEVNAVLLLVSFIFYR